MVDAGTRTRRPRMQPHGACQRQINSIVHFDDKDDDDCLKG